MDFGSSIYLSKYCGLQIGFFLLREMLIDRYRTWLSLLPKVFINNKGFMCPNRMPQYYSFTIMVKFRYIYSSVSMTFWLLATWPIVIKLLFPS